MEGNLVGGSRGSFYHGSMEPNSLVNCQIVEEALEPSPWECEAYEQYVRLPQLRTLWDSNRWPAWRNESLVKPALQALEINFRFISYILCDPRAYINKAEWVRRLEFLVNNQVELISIICEGDNEAPTIQLSVSKGVLGNGAQEVWQRPGALPVVSRSSEESLLPRLATWKRAEDLVARLRLSIECHMQRVPFTLGLGEPNLVGKPILDYDSVCQPSYVYSLKHLSQGNAEDSALSSVHQIMEAWLQVADNLVDRIHDNVVSGDTESASRDSWTVERIWRILRDAVNLLLLMDPDDFLKLKQQLVVNSTGLPTGAYCLRSRRLKNVTKGCKDLRRLVPKVVGVEADPKGGPRLQEAVMGILHCHGLPKSNGFRTVHLLQAFQAIEAAVKSFFFSYQQLVIVVMGSVEIKGSSYRGGAVDVLSQVYMEPPYFPSVDGAKTFLGDYWHYTHQNSLLCQESGKGNKLHGMCGVQSDASMSCCVDSLAESDEKVKGA